MSEDTQQDMQHSGLSSFTREQLESIIDASPLGMAITRYYDGIIVYVNTTLAKWGLKTVDEMIGSPAMEYYRDMDAIGWVLEELQAERTVNNYEMRMNRSDGSWVWRQVNMVAIWVDEERMILTWYNDIDELRAAREKLERMATHDNLTGIANIAHFDNFLAEAVERAARDMCPASLLYLDLDGFKSVNDRYGHQIGNRVLVQVVKRMLQAVRNSDFLARIGGDEFAVIIESGDDGVQTALTIAESLLQHIQQPYLVDDIKIQIGVSIGITHFVGEDSKPDRIITQADNAMYRAKYTGKNRVCVYDPAIDN